MNRLEKFHAFKNMPMQRELFKRLTANEIQMCVDFIIERSHLNADDFADKCNRWLLDKQKPTNYSTMCDLVLQTNAKERQ